ERPAHVASSTYPPESLHHILRCDSPYIVHEPIVEVHSGEDDTYIETIPRPHRRYPAVARSLRRAKNPTSQVLPIVCQEAWTEKWRPRRADEVIGNEERALYLREWLVSLRLQMTSGSEPSEVDRRNKKRKPGKNRKPEIVRHVKKKRKTGDGLADFLASDDEESIHDFISGADEDDFEFCQRMQDRIGYSSATTPDGSSQYSSSALSEFEDFPVDLDEELPFSFTLPNFGSRIHNTILLAGPPGCGKTAAVYACAEELGWEVFEVYPGIGERSGPELNKLVGDIGKNHIVHSTLRRSPPRHHQYFSRGGKIERKSVIEIDSDDDQVLPIASNIDTNPAPTAEPTIKQSLVLIEEVDVLYNSDAGFWPAIISIIRDCRRPVVLTCNDISLVPWSDLPLQTTLYFEPCPSPLATSYLQACCLSEKFAIGRDHIHCLFKGALPGASGSVDARGVSPFDLRFAINQLQYLSTVLPSSLTSHTPGPMSNGSESKISHPISTSHHTLQTGFETRGSPRGPILRLLDSLSYMEGQLSRDPSYFTELHSEATSLLDAELGYTVLPLELVPHLPLVSAFYTRDYSISQEFLSLSGRGIQTDYSLLSRLDEDTSNYMAQVNQVFVQCLPSTLSSSTALFTDYLPWIRHMVSTDNAIAMDELVSSSGMQSRRQTRTSRKAAQERYVPLENAELDVLSKTAFRMDWG
ncbi:P-loop containing nucleoside triphosphate hydrolase protein, partial [Cristinia sonorae]